MTTPTPVHHVGYLGMGIMGSAMAANLIKTGFQLTVWNRTPGKCDPLVKLGAAVAKTPRELAAQKPDVICINVTDTSDVEAVIFGHDGIVHGAAPGLIVVDHSTISPTATQHFAARLKAKNIILLDAPVSGGDVGARHATLSIMVGGSPEAFHRCEPLLRAMGKTITHLGDSGMGQACKACNQIAVSCNLAGVCEAIALAEKLGLDPRRMIDVVGAGAGASWQLTHLGPKIVNHDFAPGFMIDLVLKDLAIVAAAAEELGLNLPALESARSYFQTAKSQHHAGREGTQAMAKAVIQG